MSMLHRFALGDRATTRYIGGKIAQIPASSSATYNVSLTDLTGGLKSSPSEGDLVIVYYGVNSGSNPSLYVVGYTTLTDLYYNDTEDANLGVFYKVMTSTPDTSIDVSPTTPPESGYSSAGVVAIHVWAGIDRVVPFDIVIATATGGNSVLCNPPAVTPVTSGAIIIAGGVGAYGSTSVKTFSSSDLSNFITGGNSSGSYETAEAISVGVGSKVWTSGSFDPAAFTFSSADSLYNSWAAATLVLLPEQTNPGPFAISKNEVEIQSGSTSLVISKPPAVRENDLLIAFMNSAAAPSATWTGDTGWTEVADQGSSPSTRVAYKVASASEPSSYTFTQSTSSWAAGTIIAYRNAAYDAVGAFTTAYGNNVAAVTTSVPYSLILANVADSAVDSLAVPTDSINYPPSMYLITQETGNDWAPARVITQDKSFSSAGSSGTRYFTSSTYQQNTTGILAAIKPASSYVKYANYAASATAAGTGSGSVWVNTSSFSNVPGNLLLLVASVVGTDTTDRTITSGSWTLLSEYRNQSTAYQPALCVFYRVADGTESSTVGASPFPSSSGNYVVAATITLAGVDPSTLKAGTTNTGSNTTSITANEITVDANSILLYFGVQANNNQGPVTFTPPSGMTEVAERSINSTADMTLEIAYQENVSAGATGNKTATTSANLGTNKYAALLVSVAAK